MTTLTQLKSLGIRTLTVNNNLATAVNPYEKYYKHEGDTILHPAWMNIDELPPLPTSGIPDGTVSIEEVEEEKQVLIHSGGSWSCCSNEQFELYTKRGYETRTAIVPKKTGLSDKIVHINCDPEALKDPEFVDAVNHMAELAYNMPVKSKKQVKEASYSEDGSLDDYYNAIAESRAEKQVKEEEPKPLEQIKTDAYERAYKPKEMREAQEQTAEGIVDNYFPDCDCGEMYKSRNMTAPDCVRCNYLETVNEGAKAYADSQLAQYKEKLIAAIDDEYRDTEFMSPRIFDKTIDLIRNTK